MKSLAFIVVGLTVGILLMFVLMNSGFLINPSKNTNTLNEKPLVQNIPSGSPSASSTPSALPSPSGNLVTAGGKLVFVKYSLTLPTGWTSDKELVTSDIETLYLKSGGYKISITQSPSEGRMCRYEGNQADVYKYYKDLSTKDGTMLRRSGESATGAAYEVCAYSTPNSNYQQPTQYGFIVVTTPTHPTDAMLQEIDGILSSLKKI